MKQVISISRRTDVVAFFSAWLRRALQDEHVVVNGPRGTSRAVSLRPQDVHSLVFWSKNYAPLLHDAELQRLLRRYENVYFHFTITGLGGTVIEPSVLPHPRAIQQLGELVALWGTKRVNWRFDPIVHWTDEEGRTQTNVPLFREIAACVTQFGVLTCTFSFAQWYGKIPARARAWNVAYVDPAASVKRAELSQILAAADSLGIKISTCAQDAWLDVPSINKGHCIDGGALTLLHPKHERASIGKDRGQREECGCTPSIDIGSYAQACPHGCAYCYATPLRKPVGQSGAGAHRAHFRSTRKRARSTGGFGSHVQEDG